MEIFFTDMISITSRWFSAF